ncbi:MAG: hypothetical protein EHM59_07275 [Betaproteobacteria bacterium]|nr:MAG: hypothetical protein EHM59_07275 [Betaproteobacteria bacterium]
MPFPPGGNTDIIARIVAPRMSESLGQQLIIANRGGAGSTIGTELAARSPADGYTILMVSAAHTINPAMAKKLPYDSVKDFTPISVFGPAKLSRPIVDRVHGSIKAALSDPEVRKKLSDQGADPVGSTPAEHDKFNRAEIAKWIKVARGAGIEPQ